MVDFIREVEMTIREAIPQSFWYSSSVIDIGSGNTKGGYYVCPAKSGDALRMLGIEFFGIKSYAPFIEKKHGPQNLQE